MKKIEISKEDQLLFYKIVDNITPLKQDKIWQMPISFQKKHIKNTRELDTHRAYFLDIFHMPLNNNKICYLRKNTDLSILNKFQRGYYPPEISLDLHGFTRQQAKRELAILMQTAQKKQISCVRLIHGHGKQILKKYIPMWLAQHPLVVALHQPSEPHTRSVLLALIENDTLFSSIT